MVNKDQNFQIFSPDFAVAFPFPPPLPAHTMAMDAQMEDQFYGDLPTQGRGPMSTVMVLGLPLRWIVNKYFQQEFKEWLRTRAGVQSKGTEILKKYYGFGDSGKI